jgi:hypothetical protein
MEAHIWAYGHEWELVCVRASSHPSACSNLALTDRVDSNYSINDHDTNSPRPLRSIYDETMVVARTPSTTNGSQQNLGSVGNTREDVLAPLNYGRMSERARGCVCTHIYV